MEQKEVTNLTKLNIYEVTDAKYAEILESSEFDENAIYLTPNSGGGGSTLTVHLTYSGGSEGTWTADKTWAEIEAAYDPENCCIYAEYTENSVVNTLQLTGTDSEGSFIFGKLKTENYGGYDQFIINTNDEVIYEYYQFQSSTTTIRRWNEGQSSES